MIADGHGEHGDQINHSGQQVLSLKQLYSCLYGGKENEMIGVVE